MNQIETTVENKNKNNKIRFDEWGKELIGKSFSSVSIIKDSLQAPVGFDLVLFQEGKEEIIPSGYYLGANFEYTRASLCPPEIYSSELRSWIKSFHGDEKLFSNEVITGFSCEFIRASNESNCGDSSVDTKCEHSNSLKKDCMRCSDWGHYIITIECSKEKLSIVWYVSSPYLELYILKDKVLTLHKVEKDSCGKTQTLSLKLKESMKEENK